MPATAKSLLLTILFLWMAALCSGQSTSYSRDTASINKLLQFTGKILNPDSAIILYDSAYSLSEKANYPDGAFIATITKGIKYFEKQDYEAYRRVSYEALPWAEKSTQPDAVAWCLINVGEAYFSEGDYTTANELYYKALQDMNRKTRNITHTTANIYNSLGMVNLRMNQYAKALSYFDMAYQAAQQANLPYQLAIACDNKSAYYITLHQPDSAMKYLQQEIKIGQAIGKVDLIAFAHAKMGKVYILQRNYEKAIQALNHAIALARNRFNPPVVDAAYSLAHALLLSGKYPAAESMLTWAYTETRTHNYKDYYLLAYRQLADLHKVKGQPDKALQYMDSLLLLKDSLTNADNARAINHLEIKYQTSEKDLKLAASKLLIERQQGALARKNIMVWSGSGGILLLAGLLGLLYRNARNRQRLQDEQIKSLQQVRTIDMLNARVEGEEKERGRLARELHDGIGGILSAAMMRLSTVPREAPDVARLSAYKDAMNLLQEMGEEIRKTSHNLMPDALMKQNLGEALQALCKTIHAEGILNISYQNYGNYEGISEDVKLNIYRIVQELLRNIVQHAHATRVLVQTQRHHQHLNITVEDNGSGYDPANSATGIGLYNLAARVRSLGGNYTVDTAPGKGTTVNIEIDLN